MVFTGAAAPPAAGRLPRRVGRLDTRLEREELREEAPAPVREEADALRVSRAAFPLLTMEKKEEEEEEGPGPEPPPPQPRRAG